jgi:hypothetical protein
MLYRFAHVQLKTPVHIDAYMRLRFHVKTKCGCPFNMSIFPSSVSHIMPSNRAMITGSLDR